MFIPSSALLTRVELYFAVISLALFAVQPLTAAAQAAETKVVVIPMAGDEARCTWRFSDSTTLSGSSGQIISYCQADETIISGGYGFNSFNSTRNCRAMNNLPVKKDPYPNDGWLVYWSGTSSTQCNDFKVYTAAFCCKK